MTATATTIIEISVIPNPNILFIYYCINFLIVRPFIKFINKKIPCKQARPHPVVEVVIVQQS